MSHIDTVTARQTEGATITRRTSPAGGPNLTIQVDANVTNAWAQNLSDVYKPPGKSLWYIRPWTCLTLQWSCLTLQWTCLTLQWTCLTLQWTCHTLQWTCLTLHNWTGLTTSLKTFCATARSAAIATVPICCESGSIYLLPLAEIKTTFLLTEFKKYAGNMIQLIKLFISGRTFITQKTRSEQRQLPDKIMSLKVSIYTKN